MTERANEQWLEALRAPGPLRDDALADLQLILLSGLQRGLLGRVDTAVPEFEAQAEDFVQEALLNILDNLDSFAGRSKFTTWAHKITVHVALTELRRKRWQDASLDQLTNSAAGDHTPGFIADPAPAPEEVATREEMLAQINELIVEELTDKQRQVVQLSIIQGLPAAAVARQMDTNPNAVYKLLHDARLRLKDRLAERDLTPEDVLAVFSE